MKKLFIGCSLSMLLLAGCLETTHEITLQDEGSGKISYISGMGNLLDFAKMMDTNNELDAASEKNMDTTFSMASQADSIAGLTEQEKLLVKTGTMNVKMNLKEGLMQTGLHFPFSGTNNFGTINQLIRKINAHSYQQQLNNQSLPGMGEDAPAYSALDDYYQLSISEHSMEYKLDKEKYAALESDQFLKSMDELSSMGMAPTSTWIIHLPHPAKIKEGDHVSLSEDKMTVNFKISLDDLMKNPEKPEFKIKF